MSTKKSIPLIGALLGIGLIHYSNSVAREAVLCQNERAVSYETYLIKALGRSIPKADATETPARFVSLLGKKLKDHPAFFERLKNKLAEIGDASHWLSPSTAAEAWTEFELPSNCRMVSSAVLEGSQPRRHSALADANLPGIEKRAAELRLALLLLDPARRELPARDLATALISEGLSPAKISAAVKKFEASAQAHEDFMRQPHVLVGTFEPSSAHQSSMCPKSLSIEHDGARGLSADVSFAGSTLRVRFEADPVERSIAGDTFKSTLFPTAAYAEFALGTDHEEKITIDYNMQYGEVSVKMVSKRYSSFPAVGCWYKRSAN